MFFFFERLVVVSVLWAHNGPVCTGFGGEGGGGICMHVGGKSVSFPTHVCVYVREGVGMRAQRSFHCQALEQHPK